MKLKTRFAAPVVREVLLNDAALADMQVVTRMRLSVSKCSEAHYKRILELANVTTT